MSSYEENLDQMRANTLLALRAQLGVSDDGNIQQTSDEDIRAVPGLQVSSYIGDSGLGLVKDAARLFAGRLNRINTDDTVTYTAEPHGDPNLPKAWAVVGRRVEEPDNRNVAAREDDASTTAPPTSATIETAMGDPLSNPDQSDAESARLERIIRTGDNQDDPMPTNQARDACRPASQTDDSGQKKSSGAAHFDDGADYLKQKSLQLARSVYGPNWDVVETSARGRAPSRAKPSFSDARFEHDDPKFADTRALSWRQKGQQLSDSAGKWVSELADAIRSTEGRVAQRVDGLASDIWHRLTSTVNQPRNQAANMYPDYDLGTQTGMRQFLDDVSWKRRTGENLSDAELATAQTILSAYYGVNGSLDKAIKTWDDLSPKQADDRFSANVTKYNVWSQLNRQFQTNVDFSALSQFEGGQRLNGYIPRDENGVVLGKSGVTIGTGFDIGQYSAQQIKDFHFPIDLEAKLLPYAGRKKSAAVEALAANPLIISRAEAGMADLAVKGLHLSAAIESWDSHKRAGTPAFTELTPAQQTVIFSRTYHQGIGMPETDVAHDFYTAAQTNRWKDAETALRNYPVDPAWYQNRVAAEANLLQLERNKNGK